MKTKYYKAFAKFLAITFTASIVAPVLQVNASIVIPGEEKEEKTDKSDKKDDARKANSSSSSGKGAYHIVYNSETRKFEKVYDNEDSDTIKFNDNSSDSILNPKYFDDDYFYQLNTAVLVPEIYALSDYNRLQSNTPVNYAYNSTIDVSHIIKKYVAPVTASGTSYMNVYDYTYVYSNDELTAAFMERMESDSALRNKIMTSNEYSDLVSVYNQYVNNANYDVNPYVYHYIAEYIDITYGDKLFDYDFYCEKYPSLAMLFEYDEEALKQHFYSVGMFEGRQAIDSFNVDNYTTDNDDFGTYYIKYVTTSDSNNSYKKSSSDKTQIRLYDVGFDSYVADVTPDHKSSTYVKDLASPYVQGELNAQACHRVRFQLGDYTAQGHNALTAYKTHTNMLGVWGLKFSGTPFDGAENAWTEHVTNVNSIPDLTDSMVGWRQCDSHYQAAISAEYIYIGQSHPYVDYNPNAGTSANTGVGLRANKYYATVMTWMYNDYGASKISAYYE